MPYAGLINPVGAPPPQQPQLQGYAPMNPIPAVPQEGPPTTPQELEQRKSGWQNFMTQIQTDPNMRQAALLAASTMMQGPGMGETVGNTLGRSLEAGILAHGFGKANQTRMELERQKFEQERMLNQAQIAQQQAQTSGLHQTQEFQRGDRPYVVRGHENKLTKEGQEISQGDFQAQNRGRVLESSLQTEAQTRRTNRQQGDMYDRRNRDLQYDDNGNPIPGSGKEPLSAKDLHYQKIVRRAHPRMEGESEADYDIRLAQIELGKDDRSMDAVVVQSAQHLLANADPGSEEHSIAVKALADVVKRQGKGNKGKAAAPTTKTKEEWLALSKTVPIGQKYKGFDGKMYTRID